MVFGPECYFFFAFYFRVLHHYRVKCESVKVKIKKNTGWNWTWENSCKWFAVVFSGAKKASFDEGWINYEFFHMSRLYTQGLLNNGCRVFRNGFDAVLIVSIYVFMAIEKKKY